MSISIQPKTGSKNVNDIWKDLDPIFQCHLRSLILSNKKKQFNKVTKELGFNAIQKQFLFNAIQIAETQPIPSYVIPNPRRLIPNKRQNIIGKKRKINTIANDSSSQSDTDNNCNNNNNKKLIKKRRKKRRKKNNNNKSYDLSDKEKREIEKDGFFVVDDIIGHKHEGNNIYKYRVKWVGYDDITWEPKQHLEITTIKKYWKNKGFKIDKYDNIKPIKPTKNKMYKCEICNVTFNNGQAYGGHCSGRKHIQKRKEINDNMSENNNNCMDEEETQDENECENNNKKEILVIDSD